MEFGIGTWIQHPKQDDWGIGEVFGQEEHIVWTLDA
jgi:Protein of unknown function (DUF3553)